MSRADPSKQPFSREQARVGRKHPAGVLVAAPHGCACNTDPRKQVHPGPCAGGAGNLAGLLGAARHGCACSPDTGEQLLTLRLSQVGQNTWLAFWSQHTTTALEAGQPLRPAFYLSIYAALALGAISLQAIRSYRWAPSGLRSCLDCGVRVWPGWDLHPAAALAARAIGLQAMCSCSCGPLWLPAYSNPDAHARPRWAAQRLPCVAYLRSMLRTRRCRRCKSGDHGLSQALCAQHGHRRLERLAQAAPQPAGAHPAPAHVLLRQPAQRAPAQPLLARHRVPGHQPHAGALPAPGLRLDCAMRATPSPWTPTSCRCAACARPRAGLRRAHPWLAGCPGLWWPACACSCATAC